MMILRYTVLGKPDSGVAVLIHYLSQFNLILTLFTTYIKIYDIAYIEIAVHSTYAHLLNKEESVRCDLVEQYKIELFKRCFQCSFRALFETKLKRAMQCENIKLQSDY